MNFAARYPDGSVKGEIEVHLALFKIFLERFMLISVRLLFQGKVMLQIGISTLWKILRKKS